MTRNTIDATSPSSRFLPDTPDVVNVARDLPDHNLYGTDVALRETVAREGAAWADAELEFFALGALANRFPPEPETHDRSATAPTS